MKYFALLANKRFISALLMLVGVIAGLFGKNLDVDIKPEILEAVSYIVTTICITWGYSIALQAEPIKKEELKDDK